MRLDLLVCEAFRVGALVGVWVGVAAVATAGGNVTAFVDRAGNLVVIGDELGNNITICSQAACSRASAPDDAVWVFSLNGQSVPDTTVNGMPGYPGVWFVPSGECIRVRANGGADRVECRPPYRASIELDGGDGHDLLSLDGQFGEVRIVAGSGDDLVALQEGFQVFQDCWVDTGEGSDVLSTSLASIGLEGGICMAKMGPGDDRFLFQDYVDCHAPILVDMGPGADSAVFTVGLRFFDDFALSTGPGRDLVTIDDLTVTGRFEVATGSEDDVLSLAGTLALGRTILDGGSGLDRFMDLGSNSFPGGPPKLLGFEVTGNPLWIRSPYLRNRFRLTGLPRAGSTEANAPRPSELSRVRYCGG